MILVILPSKNEAKTIGHVTHTIDRGLSLYFPNNKAIILNVDSSSSDDTVKMFLDVPTINLKFSIVLDQIQKSKGYNIHQGIKFGLENEVSYFLMFDTDLLSIKAEWIPIFLSPLISKEADFVSPIYKRNRYEANTTNHFSSPIISSFWGIDIQQPIAGDFAFSASFGKQISADLTTESDYKYGIDTMLTCSAIACGWKTKQVLLDNKIHSPSFSKITEIFPQVCSTTLWMIHKYSNTRNISEKTILNPNGNMPDDNYIVVPDPIDVSKLGSITSQMMIENQIPYNVSNVDADVWSNEIGLALAETLNAVKVNDCIVRITNRISALYFARVICYINWLSGKTPSEITAYLFHQKKAINQNIIKQLKS